jgi:nitrogen fixation-related uncharacterized protein
MNWDLILYLLILFVPPGIIIGLMFYFWYIKVDEAEFDDTDEARRQIKKILRDRK